ncbi:MAG: hypothetical protein OK439_06280 [Thaumarchaeota archaeon]|nr:hypothetical protein [Nitrososphaerota archaeon]
MSSPFGVEPQIYKVLVYNQLTPEEVLKTNYDVKKMTFWDVSASIPGKTSVDDPHISVYWYGPNVSAEKGFIIHLKPHKLDEKFITPIRSVVEKIVGGQVSSKENGSEFKDFTMKISYSAIADLAKAIQNAGKLNCECSLEFEMITKEERAASTLSKTKILGEKALEK